MKPSPSPQPARQESRKPPEAGIVKVNIDAAFREMSEAGAWDFVARDETGSFLAAAAGKMEHVRSSL